MLPDGATLEKGSGGLERLAITTRESRAQIYLHGAHVAHFQPEGARPVLWVSRQSNFVSGTPGKPIRGGIPVCFPWFAQRKSDPTAPMHGFARLLTWRLGEVTHDPAAGARATLHLSSSDFTRGMYAHDFEVSLTVTVNARLTIEFAVRNTGATPMTFENALHSYFAVGDSRQIAITGLEGAPYIDKVDGWARKTETTPIAIAGETDRHYLGAKGKVTIVDPVWQRRIGISKSGSATTVVWNPWIAKAKALPDFGDDEWPEMVCVETTNALDDAVTLAPGATHVTEATIAIEGE
jgi:D-hexose-6-phosphate mutarotase